MYHCAIDKALFAKKIEQAQTYAADLADTWISIAGTEMNPEQITPLKAFGFQPHPADDTRFRAPSHPAAITYLTGHTITHQIERTESTTTTEIRLRVEAVNRWYVHDWNTLDNKIRSSIVEGVSVFLSMFDLPSVARVFCPPAADRPGWPRTARAPRHRLERRSSAPRSPHRERQGAGLEYARRHQPRARPGDRRDAQKCVAPIAPAPAGDDAGRARSLRPTGRLYL